MRILPAAAALAGLAVAVLACNAVDLAFFTEDAIGVGDGGAAPFCKAGATAVCYDGPPATEGVGLCKAGTKICAADGLSWGACVGEVAPAEAGAPGACQDPQWVEPFGGTEIEGSRFMAVDAAGEVVIAGQFSGTIDFGGGPLTSQGGLDVFVVKLTPDGTLLWSKSFGGPGDQQPGGVAVDSVGNVVLSGEFADSIDFGGGPLVSAAMQSVFVAQLGPDGATRWSKGFGDTGEELGGGIAVNAKGNIAVTGGLSGTIDFGGGPLASTGDQDVFVAMFDTSGSYVWAKSFGEQQAQAGGGGAAFDVGGNVIISGSFIGSVDFGGGLLTCDGGLDIFVAKFDPSGTHMWSKNFGGTGTSATALPYGFAVGPCGEVYLTGFITGTVDLGNGPLTSAGGFDVFLSKLNAAGEPQWSQRFGDPQEQSGISAAVDAEGNVVITGEMQGTADFGGGTLTSAGGYDVFVAKFGPDGTPVWSKRYGDPQDQGGQGIVTDPEGNVIVTGNFSGTIDFGPGPLASTNAPDVFVAKLCP